MSIVSECRMGVVFLLVIGVHLVVESHGWYSRMPIYLSCEL